jgi:hypothetical protein
VRWNHQDVFPKEAIENFHPIPIAGGGAGEKHSGGEEYVGHGVTSTSGGTVNGASAAENGGGVGAEYVAGGNTANGGNGYDRQDAASGGGGYKGHGGNCSIKLTGRAKEEDFKSWFGGRPFRFGCQGGYDTEGNWGLTSLRKGGLVAVGAEAWEVEEEVDTVMKVEWALSGVRK